MTISKEWTMGQLLDAAQAAGRLDPVVNELQNAGMHCIGCPSSIHESLEQACMVHGLDADEVLANIHKYLADKESK